MKRPISLIAALGLYCFASSSIAHAQEVKADTGAIAIGGSVSGSTIIIGFPPEKVDELVRNAKRPLEELTTQQRDNIVLLKEKLDLNERQVRAALAILGEKDIPPERLAPKLVEIAERFKALQGTSSAQPGDGPTIAALKADVQKALDAGELAKADALLADVEMEQRRGLAVSVADTSARRGEIALTRLRYREAAMHFAKAAAELARAPQGNADKMIVYIYKQALALSQQGDEFGDNEALLLAIERYKALAAVMMRQEGLARVRAMIQVSLGAALATLGERKGDRARLEEAVAAYREALKELTRKSAPLEWAQTQSNLGSALLMLAQRESDTATLEEALAAYREALKERTRDSAPLEWAHTQSDLGSALATLGKWESSTAMLEEALAAYRESLQERTRERVPLDWARTQNNLGGTLLSLGELESGTAKLDEAVIVYRKALQELTRERVRLEWAGAQNNLGRALAMLGERENNTARLEEAVAAYREALKEWTREGVPLDWAGTQNNLGLALADLGTLKSNTANLEEAVAAYREALKERTRERVPLDWAGTQNNLGLALAVIGEREGNTARLEEAVAAYRDALTEWTRERAPQSWGVAQRNLVRELRNLGYARFNRGDFAVAALHLQEAVDRTNAYSILWLYLASARAGRQDAKMDLEKMAAGLKPAEWPFPVIRLFLGQATPEVMLAAANNPEQRCEAQYYLGEWHLLRDARANAIKVLQEAVKGCPKDFIEYTGALAELKRLAQ
jgi:tetratricopeptide (TPR) repeat protein